MRISMRLGWDSPHLGVSVGTWLAAEAMDQQMQRVADDFQRFADSAGDLLSRERRRLYEQLLKSAPRLLQRYHSHREFYDHPGRCACLEHFLAERSPVRRCAPLRLGCLEARGRVARPCLHDRDALVSRPSKEIGKLSPRRISRHACCSRSSGLRPDARWKRTIACRYFGELRRLYGRLCTISLP